MKQLIGAVLLIAAVASTGYPQVQQQRQRLRPPDAAPQNPPRPRANGPLQDVVLGFYISQFQQVAEVNDEVFAKILPFLREFVSDRFEISARRTRSLNQIRQLINRGGSDDDIKRMIKELDQADADGLANQQKFLTNADPLLTAQQQAKVRSFQAMPD